MAVAKKGYEPIKTGYDPRGKDAGGFLKVEPNSYVDVVMLADVEDILSCEQCAIWFNEGDSPVWVFQGPGDPSEDLIVAKNYKAFVPVLEMEDGKPVGDPKVWSMTKSPHSQLLEIADAGGGNLKGMALRIKRTGSGLQTRYSINFKGKRFDVSSVPELDIISLLGPLDIEGVQKLIAEKVGLESYDEVLRLYRGKKIFSKVDSDGTGEPKKKAARPKGGASKGKIEDADEEDLEEVELS